jgi:transposase InsO family protein
MTGDSRMFNSIEDNDHVDSITFGDNGKGEVKGLGRIAICNDLSILNVLLVESLNFNLLSVAQICDLGFKCIFGPEDVEIISLDGKNMAFKGFRYENLYLVDFGAKEAQLSTCLISKSSLGWLWHRRLGHVGMKQLNRLVKYKLVRGLDDVVFEKDKLCSACQVGKQVANTHPKKSIMSTFKPFELLHMDLFGPTTYTSIGGNKYGFVIVDDFSRYTWVFFLHDKSDTFDLFKSFVKRVYNEFDFKIKRVRSDNGNEFKNTRVDELCDDLGIKHQFSAKYTSQSNDIVERKNRTLIEMARSMLNEYDVSEAFWAEAINTACYSSNRLYCHPKLELTPYELLNDRKPSIAHLRVFGCKCYILRKGTKLGKFDKKCDEGFLLGYSTNSKAYRVWNLSNGTLEEVHDVEFDETKGSHDEEENLDDVRGTQLSNAMKNMDVGDIMQKEVIDVEDDKDQVITSPNVQASGSYGQASSSAQIQDQQVASTSSQPNDQPSSSNQVPMTQNTSIARDHPLDQIIGGIQSGVQTRSRLAQICAHFSFVSFEEPKTIQKALEDNDWIIAMQEELNNFERNEVWDLVERPKDHNVIGTK